MKSFKAFTLVELMVVIAILGILSAIAFPIFLKYTIRAKLSASFSEISILRRDVQMSLDQGADISSAEDIGAPTTSSNCSSISVVGTAQTGAASVTCTIANGPAAINGKTLTWSRTNTSGWVCSSSVNTADAITGCPGA